MKIDSFWPAVSGISAHGYLDSLPWVSVCAAHMAGAWGEFCLLVATTEQTERGKGGRVPMSLSRVQPQGSNFLPLRRNLAIPPLPTGWWPGFSIHSPLECDSNPNHKGVGGALDMWSNLGG